MPRVGEELSLALALLLVGRAAEVHTTDTAGLGPVTSAGQRFTDANGCSVTVLGCYWDKQWADCRYKTFPAQPSCTQPPSYQKARDLHIALNVVNTALFTWQIPTGLEIVGKVFQFTSWP